MKNGGLTYEKWRFNQFKHENGWIDDNGHDEKEPIDWRYRFHIFLAYFVGLI